MFAIRIYLSALTLTFVVVALMTRGIGVLEATVVVCGLLYTILDARDELQALRSLETRVRELFGAEQARYTDVIDGLGLDPETPEQLRRASRRVEDARYAGQRGPSGTD